MNRFRRRVIISIIFFAFYTFFLNLFIHGGDVEGIVWSWILSMIILSPLLPPLFLYLYLKDKPINTKKILVMILVYVICLSTLFQLTILIAGKYESWMSGAFIFLTVICCIPLCKLIYSKTIK